VAYETATGLGIRAGSRAVFLDDSDAPAQIRKQLGRLSRIALRKGKAIAIGHPRPATLAALRDELPALRDKGIAVVRVSELLDRTEGTK
ncbi:MAG TPA: divergent polysaccharide deacetylase family protein, partial [Nitrospirota bacterium]|nr:divergent polysaccharide deacetylase family protein [Nitrospirota bacterium]